MHRAVLDVFRHRILQSDAVAAALDRAVAALTGGRRDGYERESLERKLVGVEKKITALLDQIEAGGAVGNA